MPTESPDNNATKLTEPVLTATALLAVFNLPRQELVLQDRDGSQSVEWEEILDNLIRKLVPLGESGYPLTQRALEKICVKDALLNDIDSVSIQLRSHLHYVTKPCDVGLMTVLMTLLIMG